MKKCGDCGNKAGKSEFNPTGDLHCEGCGKLLYKNCMVGGFDLLPRCEKCHYKHIRVCYDECRGNKEKAGCEFCEFC